MLGLIVNNSSLKSDNHLRVNHKFWQVHHIITTPVIWLAFRWAPHAVARLRAHEGGVQLITPPVRKRKEREGDQVAQLAYCLMPRTISKQNFVNLLANRSPCLKDVGNQSHICHHMHPSLLSKAPLKELTLYTLPFFFFQMVRYLF